MKITPERPDLGLIYKNEFKENNVYPICEIGRVVVDKNTGEILQVLNELDSRLDVDGNPSIFNQELHDIMVKFPKFYYKRSWNGEIFEEHMLELIPPKKVSLIPKQIKDLGFEVYPCFLDDLGNVRDYVLIGSFAGIIVDSQLRSYPKPDSVHARISRTTGRNAAVYGRTGQFSILTIDLISMIRFLFKFCFHTLDYACVKDNVNTVDPSTVITTEMSTLALGNRSGYFNKKLGSLFGLEILTYQSSENIDGCILLFSSSRKTLLFKYCLNPLLADKEDNYTTLGGEELSHVLTNATTYGSTGYPKTIYKEFKYFDIGKEMETGLSDSVYWGARVSTASDTSKKYMSISRSYGLYGYSIYNTSTASTGVCRLCYKPECVGKN